MPVTVVETITIRPWFDPVVDTVGHDPRSNYVETFWLPTLGPTAVLLLRRLADRLDRTPGGLVLPVADTSRRLGLGEREGPTSPLLRTLRRLEQFRLAAEEADADSGEPGFLVRRFVPPVSPRHVRRMPASLAREHDEYLAAALAQPPAHRSRSRARRLAFVLLETGDEQVTIERALLDLGFPPPVATEAIRWAISRHHAANAAAIETGPEAA
jgi:hypothetical protein